MISIANPLPLPRMKYDEALPLPPYRQAPAASEEVAARIVSRPLQVLAVTSEVFPLIKTGGLADVTGALPKALTRFGIRTHTLVPGYPSIVSMARLHPPLMEFDNLLGEPATLRHLEIDGLSIFVLDAPSLFDRPGGPYVDTNGLDHPDNWKRFAVLSLAGAEIAAGALPGWRPDLVHTHDWQTALTSVYLKQMGASVPTVLTIHNLAFQGQFSASLLPQIGLSPEAFSIDCLEYYGDISYLKGGLTTAAHITVVSPTYAREILSSAFGMGMDGVLNARLDQLEGIVNGIDTEIWNPATDPYLPHRYDQKSVRHKAKNKAILLDRFGLDPGEGPLFSAVTRMTWQKGMDMLADVADEIFRWGGKLIVLGQGDSEIIARLNETAARFPGKMAVSSDYNEAASHLIHGGSDAIIQPSRFEPCGLTQLYALRYGCVPVVSRTGGLAETIIDANDAAMAARVATGFQFHPVEPEGLRHALRRTASTYRDKRKWDRLQLQAMRADYSWDRSAERYGDVYMRLARSGHADRIQDRGVDP
ncbi:glycogen synthase GlgA [Peteryoungia ipomoeae]|nr:glycogen synthase GlgA [Peteryoungia ipomoeae]